MNNQEFNPESDIRTSAEGFLIHRLSDLHLDIMSTDSSTNAVCNRAAGFDDSVSHSYQVDLSDRSPPRKRIHLRRRSLSPPQPLAGADAVVHRLISEEYQFLDLPGGDSGQKDSSSLRRYFSLDCTGGKPIPAAEVENQTRRSLFPSPLSFSGATAAILPPLPLGRTVSDPVRLRSPLIRDTTPVPRTDYISSTAAHLLPHHRPLARTTSDSTRLTNSILQNSPYEGFNSTEESSSDKRLTRADSAKKIRQQMDKIKDWIDQLVEEDSAMIPIIPEPEVIPAEKTMRMTNEAPPQEEVVEKEIEEEDLEPEADMVKARKVGECTMLEFKCRCGSAYSVAIFGNSCYYKLT